MGFPEFLTHGAPLAPLKILLIGLQAFLVVQAPGRKETGMLVVSLSGANFGLLVALRIFRIKRQYF